MWEQDDWNSYEDLTLCQAQSWACDHSQRSDAMAKRRTCRYSAYPVGCEPDKEAEAQDEHDGGGGGTSRDAKRRSATRAPLLECIRRRKRSWKDALGRLIAACRSREGAGRKPATRPPRATDHAAHHQPGYRKASSCRPFGPPPQPIRLWSISQAISRRFTGLTIPPPLVSRQQESPQGSRKSTMESLSTSTNSSISSMPPVKRESDPHQPDLSAPDHPYQLSVPALIPPLDTVLEPFEFAPTDLMEELR